MPYKDPEAHREHTRAYNRAYSRAYNLAHKAEIAAKNHAYQMAHKEELAAKARVYNAARKETMNAISRAYYHANKAELIAKNRAYKATHKEEMRAYRLAHSGQIAANTARYRARKIGASVNDLTPAQWEEIKAAYGHRCVYCGRKMQRLTKDHIVPLIKGGQHTYSNIVPACHSCNARKGARAPLIPVQPLLLTVAASRTMRSDP